MRNILKSKLNRGNIILAINAKSVSIVKYVAGIIIWTKMKLEEIYRRTRKLMTIYGALTLKQMLIDCTFRYVREGEVS